jgi:hypothetical protein
MVGLGLIALGMSACVELQEGEEAEAVELEVARAVQPLSWTNVVGRLTAANASVEDVPDESKHTHDWVEDGRRYAIDENSPLARHRLPSTLWLRGDGSPPGNDCIHGDCISFIGYGWPGTACTTCAGALHDNDRLEITLSDSAGPDALRIDQWRYVRFYLFVDPATRPQVQSQGAVILQVWQDHNTRFAMLPPFAIHLNNSAAGDDFVDLQFRARHDVPCPEDSEQEICYSPSPPFHTETLRKGDWYNFHLALKPQPAVPGAPRGAIQVWMQRGLQFAFDPSVPPRNDANKQFYWGYHPTNVSPDGNFCTVGLEDRCVKPRFDVRVGFYRPSGANGVALTVMRMDSVKMTKSASAMPGE